MGAGLEASEESLVWDTTCSELIVSPGCLWGGGLTSTEQEAAVMGEDNGLEDGKRPLTSEDRPRPQTKFTAGFFILSHCKPV